MGRGEAELKRGRASTAPLRLSWPSVPDQPPSPEELNLPKDEAGNVDCRALVNQLRECQTLQDQANYLYVLYSLK